MKWMIVLLLATVGLAGCLGPGGAPDEAEGQDGAEDPWDDPWEGNGTEDGPPANRTEEDGPPEPRQEWRADNRTGTVSGTQVDGVVGPSATEDFSVQSETLELYLNLSVEGDPLEARIRAPGCDEEACEVTLQSSGVDTYHRFDPEPGEWTVRLVPEASLAQVQAEYTLTIAVLVETLEGPPPEAGGPPGEDGAA